MDADDSEEYEHEHEVGIQIPEVGSSEWYEKGWSYWQAQPATVDGQMGELGFLSPIDVRTSSAFVEKHMPWLLESGRGSKQVYRAYRALDAGGGIGRVTKHVLAKYFQQIDLVDASPLLIKQSKKYLASCIKNGLVDEDHLYCEGLQTFIPKVQYYHVVWIQWVTGYLSDEHLVLFLSRVLKSLITTDGHGRVIVKDNVTDNGDVDAECSALIDPEDASIVRSSEQLEAIFIEAGLKVVDKIFQDSFPEALELFAVVMYCLEPM